MSAVSVAAPGQETTTPRIRYAILSRHQTTLLQDRLIAELPYALPLARRLEFEADHPGGSGVRVFLATAVGQNEATPEDGHGDGKANAEWVDAWLQRPFSLQRKSSLLWLAAHIDLEDQGQTQVFLYGSWEHPDAGVFVTSWEKQGIVSLEGSDSTSTTTTTPSSTSISTSTPVSVSATPTTPVDIDTTTRRDLGRSSASPAIYKALFSQLFAFINEALIPALPLTPSADWLELKRAGKYLSVPYNREKILFGSVHEAHWPWFDTPARTRNAPEYLKYVFPIPLFSSSSSSRAEEVSKSNKEEVLSAEGSAKEAPTTPTDSLLPQDYRIGELQISHLQTALDRTPIPRSLGLVRQFVSVGIFYRAEPDPVAWGFLAKEATLASFHTEDDHRRKGLAVVVGQELLKRGRDKELREWAARRERWANDASGGAGRRGTREAGAGGASDTLQHVPFLPASSTDYYYGHADVSEFNVASRRVMEKLGGVPRWRISFTEINLRQAVELDLKESQSGLDARDPLRRAGDTGDTGGASGGDEVQGRPPLKDGDLGRSV